MTSSFYARCVRFLHLGAIVTLLAGVLVAFPAAVGAAGSSTVTNCDDGLDPVPDGSLRAAVEAANADGTATALAPHTITFALDPDCDTITLAGTQLELSNHVDIQGPGEGVLAVSGNLLLRVLQVDAGVTVTISGLTISSGISNDGTLHVTGSTISGNHGLALGGGIFNTSTLHVTSSTISGNSATFGGGIYNLGILHVTGSTINGNTSEALGGGISNLGTLHVTSSTISGNTSGTLGGGIYNNSTLHVTGSTISGNSATISGGGITNLRTLHLAGTLLASNTPINCVGAITSLGYNLSSDASCELTGPGDLPDTPAGLDPVLGDNSGPTKTHALLSGSAAIDTIPPDGSAGCGASIPSDQRGLERPHGVGCDIGAYEVFVQTYYEACLFAGVLSQVQFIGEGHSAVNCGRGTPVTLLAAGDVGVEVLHACLFAGSLSLFGTSLPSNCGRGLPVSLATGTDLYGCMYAGSLSQIGTNVPFCSRGTLMGFVQSK